MDEEDVSYLVEEPSRSTCDIANGVSNTTVGRVFREQLLHPYVQREQDWTANDFRWQQVV